MGISSRLNLFKRHERPAFARRLHVERVCLHNYKPEIPAFTRG